MTTFCHALAKTAKSVCDVTLDDATMSRHRMTSRSTDERQQCLVRGQTTENVTSCYSKLRKGRMLKEKRGSAAVCERIGNKLFVTSRFSKKHQHKAKYRVLATAESTSCFTKVEKIMC